MQKTSLIQKTIIVLILIIFCLQQLSILSIAADLAEFRLESKKYFIAEAKGQISRIIPETTLEEFKSNFNTKEIHVYKDKTLKQEVTKGIVATGMYLTCHETDEVYELSVIGDLTHEGKLDQIDLNLLIKHVVGLQTAQVKGVDEVSADLSGDSKIDQIDITILIRYIMTHELYIPEIKRPEAPNVEVVSGVEVQENWYGTDVTVRIKDNKTLGVTIERTVYKITGTGNKPDTEIKGEETVSLSKEGEYKITAYSVSKEGAKSEVASKTIKIDKTAPKLSITAQGDLKTIKVKANATDASSGIKNYTYYLGTKNAQGEIDWKEGITKESKEHVFENLIKGTEYYVKVEARDKAGNTAEKTQKVSTTNIPALVDDKKTEELGDGTKANVTVEKSEEGWTNKDVILKVELDEDVDPEGKYDIEYSKDGGETWEKYDPEKGITVEENLDVEIRLTDGENHGEEITIPVTNIDKKAPELEIKTKGKSNSITVKAIATDEGSGIKEYTYYIGSKDKDGNITWGKGIKSTNPEYTFEGLEKDKEYEIKVEVEDKAGNKIEKQTSQKTEDVPSLIDDKKADESKDEEGNRTKEPNVTVTKSEEGWTNKDVILRVELDPNLDPDGELDIEYSKDGGKTWEEYSQEKGITVEENGNVKIRLTDGKNHGEEITVTVDNIDKIPPEIEIKAEANASSITVEVEATDEQSGVKEYTYYIGSKDEQGNINWKKVETTSNPEYTFKPVKQDTDYYIKVEVEDKAGNKTESKTQKVHTDKIPELVDDKKSEDSKDPEDPDGKPTKLPNITVEKSSEDDWTNQDVIIKVEVDEEVDPEGKYDIEYSKNGGETWEKYDPETGIVVKENTDVEIRLTDGTNHGEGIIVKVNNIDKKAPTGTLNYESTKTSITAKVEAEDELSGIKEYIYYIGTKDEEGNITWSEGIKSTDPEHTFENLENNTEYKIKVEIVDNAGNVTTLEKEAMTLEDISSGNYLSLTQSTKRWTSDDVIVTIKSKTTSFTTEYSEDGKTWEIFDKKQEVRMTENGTVYARVRDGDKVGDTVSLTVSNIDKEDPEVEISPTDITSRSFKVSLNARDDISGMAKIKWYYKPANIETYTEESQNYVVIGSTAKGKLEVTKEYSYTDLISGSYWVAAEVTDAAGNVTITDTIYVDPLTITSGTDGIEVTSSKRWTNQNVNVGMASKDNRYTLLTSLDKENWTETASYTLTENTSVYGKLTDGINYGEILEYRVTNIDKQNPKVTLTAKEVTSKKFTVDLHFKDENTSSKSIASNASGLGTIKWYYKNVNNENYIEEIQEYTPIHNIEAGSTDTTKELTVDNLAKGSYEIYAVVYDVAGNEVNTKDANEEETTIPSITVDLEEVTPAEGTITLAPSNNNWTNEEVTITATNTDERYKVQISQNGINYETQNQITITQNGDVYARLTDGVNAGTSTKITINNIDTSNPVATLQNTNITSKTFTMQANVQDNASGLAKIDWYMRKKGEEEYTKQSKEYQQLNGAEAGELETTKNITYEDLTSGTYEIYAVVYDVAGNETTTTKIEVTLTTITSGVNGIEITSSNENWTNQDVELTATSTDERYTVQTSSDNITWKDTPTINYEQNGTIYARLTDGINVGTPTSYELTNIDKEKAIVGMQVAEITSRSFTQTVNVTDNVSGLSKIEIYYKKIGEIDYKIKEVTYQETNGKTAGETSTSKNILVDEVLSGTYEVYVVVTDVAGNKTSTEKNAKIITLETITSGKTAITLTPSTNGWTNQDVTITAENTDEKYQVQISKNGTDWEVANQITVEQNCTAYAKLYDGVNSGEEASITIANIDKTLAEAEIECTDITTKSMDIKVTAEDQESGIANITWYYQKVGDELVNSKTQNYQTVNGTQNRRLPKRRNTKI